MFFKSARGGRKATEQLSFEEIVSDLPRKRRWVRDVVVRLQAINSLPQQPHIL